MHGGCRPPRSGPKTTPDLLRLECPRQDSKLQPSVAGQRAHREEGRLVATYCYPSNYCRQKKIALTSAPGPTRTGDLGIRRPLLYPAELRRQPGKSIQRRPPDGGRQSPPAAPVRGLAWISQSSSAGGHE